jgi:hypothetical protein
MRNPWSDVNTHGYLFAGAPLGQTYCNLYWLSKIVGQYDLKSCFELGTWHGAFSTFLGLHLPTITADIKDMRNAHTIELHDRLGVEFRQVNCHDIEVLKGIFVDLKRPTLAFCDGIYKEQEFLLMVPFLQSGDIIGVHDVGTEFNPELPQIVYCISQSDLLLLEREEATCSMYWIKK